MKYFWVILIMGLMGLGVLAINWIHNQLPFFWGYFWIYLVGVIVGGLCVFIGGIK